MNISQTIFYKKSSFF